MSKRLVEFLNNQIEWLHYDESENKYHISRHTNVEPIIEANKAFQNSGVSGHTNSAVGQHVGRCDSIVLDAYGKFRGLPNQWYYRKEYEDEVYRFFNDPDNKYWRTGGGVI